MYGVGWEMEGNAMSLIKRFKLIKMLKEYKDLISKCQNKHYTINYENMVLNIIDFAEV